jgi:hypothetical protein
MYEYEKSALGVTIQTHEKGRYILPSETSLAQWPKVETEIDNIFCGCYQNSPREEILRRTIPYDMEIHTPNNTFVCWCEPKTSNLALACPESVHQGTDPRDPWRIRRCTEWREQWEAQAAEMIATPEFRDRLTENVLDIAGITGLERMRAKNAEFILVITEREKRARALMIAGGAVVLVSAGILSLRYFAKRSKAKRARKTKGEK